MATTAVVDLVQQRIGQDSPETAERLIHAVLETVAELDLGGAQTEFAAALPTPYGQILDNPDRTTTEQLSAEEFVRRVAQRSDINEHQSETWTRAGLTALVENVPTRERNRFVAAFPAHLTDYTQWVV